MQGEARPRTFLQRHKGTLKNDLPCPWGGHRFTIYAIDHAYAFQRLLDSVANP